MWDAVFAVLFVAFLVGETVADQQQWDFHQRKARGEAEGFLTTGLFATSRHPNVDARPAPPPARQLSRPPEASR